MASKSWSNVTQEDKSVATSAQAGTIMGAEASQINPIGTSVVVSGAPNTTLGDIVVNQFPEPVAKSFSDLLHTVDTAVGTGAKVQMAASEALGQKLSDLQVGEAGLLPKIMLYLAVGGGLLLIAGRFLKR